MQLKKIKSIRNNLALATSTLLVAAPVHANTVDIEKAEKSDIDISFLHYEEADEVSERVTVNKLQAIISNELSEESKIKVGFIYDTMSGATPNGRISNNGRVFIGSNQGSGSVTVTTASGFSFNTANSSNSSSGVYIVPWKTEFSDNRIAGNINWEYALLNVLKTDIGLSVSTENDYESYSASGKFDWDINQRRTTISAGVAYNNDTVKPATGVPQGLGVLRCENNVVIDIDWLNCGEKAIFYKPAEKIILNYFFGITQVWNRKTLLQANYSFTDESGYLTDPYKQVSIVSSIDAGQEVAILYEKRPDWRATQSLFFKLVHAPTDKHTIYLSYRYFWDNWDISAHTADARFRLDFDSKTYVQPHFRVSYQTAAFFADQKIQVGDQKYNSEPDYFSADHRVSEQGTATVGIKLGKQLGKQGDFGFRVEQMRQYYKGTLLPDMKAWIIQFLLSMRY